MRVLLVDGARYALWQPKEKDLEDIVVEHAVDLFGENAFYFNRKKLIKSKAGIASIPDGYLIDLGKKKRWFVVELELSTHPIYDHIVTQIQRFKSGIRNPEARDTIRDALYREIVENPYLNLRFKEKIESGEIHHTLTRILSEDPGLAIVIDEKTRELEEAIEALGMKTEIVTLRTYTRTETTPELAVHAHTFEPMYEISPTRKVEARLKFREPILEASEMPVISRKELSALPSGDVVVCPAKPSGVDFLMRNAAWGYIFIKRIPEYFALYVSKPHWEIRYFAAVKAIIDPDDRTSPVRDSYESDPTYKKGKKVLLLEKSSLSRLKEPIPRGGNRKKAPRSMRFCPIDKFAKAKSLDDLW